MSPQPTRLTPKLPFMRWLPTQHRRSGAVGDLARDTRATDDPREAIHHVRIAGGLLCQDGHHHGTTFSPMTPEMDARTPAYEEGAK